jgi:MFS family permease
VSALFFLAGAGLGGYAAHLPDIQQKLHLTNTVLGGAMLFSSLGATSTMLFAGPLIHRFGSRHVSFFAGVALLIALTLLMAAPALPYVCGALFLIGVSTGQLDVAMNAHSMAVQDRFDRPIISAIHGWFSVGGFAGGGGVALGAKLLVPPDLSMIAASVILFAVLLWAVAWMLPSHVDKDAEGPKWIFPKGILLFLGVLAMFAFICEGAVWDWCAVYLRHSLHATAVIGSLGFGVASFTMAAGRFAGDRWIHRFGYVKVLLLSALASAAGIIWAVTAPNLALSILGFAFAGLGGSNIIPIIFRAAATRPGISAGMGLTAVSICGYTGFLLGPPAIGRIADIRSLAFSLGLTALLAAVIAATAGRSAGDLD